jgi:hypothetical protein
MPPLVLPPRSSDRRWNAIEGDARADDHASRNLTAALIVAKNRSRPLPQLGLNRQRRQTRDNRTISARRTQHSITAKTEARTALTRAQPPPTNANPALADDGGNGTSTSTEPGTPQLPKPEPRTTLTRAQPPPTESPDPGPTTIRSPTTPHPARQPAGAPSPSPGPPPAPSRREQSCRSADGSRGARRRSGSRRGSPAAAATRARSGGGLR